jgi:MFS family permease
MTSPTSARSRLVAVRGFLADQPLVDVGVAVLAAGVYWWVEVRDGSDALARLDPGAYRSVVTTLGGMAAALLGLTITAMAIVLAITPGDRLRVLLRHHRATIVSSFIAAGRALALVTGLVVYLLLFRADGAVPEWVRAVFYVALLLAALGLVRLLYVLNYLLRIGTIDKDQQTEENGPRRPGRQFRNAS